MEDLKIQKETKFLDSIGQWVVSLRLYDPAKKYDIYSPGHFHKNLAVAEENAMKEFKKSLAFQRELNKPIGKSEFIVSI